jgi:hypothetical protein
VQTCAPVEGAEARDPPALDAAFRSSRAPSAELFETGPHGGA